MSSERLEGQYDLIIVTPSMKSMNLFAALTCPMNLVCNGALYARSHKSCNDVGVS